MYTHVFFTAAGACLLAAGPVHASTVAGADPDSRSDLIFASPFDADHPYGLGAVPFTLEPEVVQGNLVEFSEVSINQDADDSIFGALEWRWAEDPGRLDEGAPEKDVGRPPDFGAAQDPPVGPELVAAVHEDLGLVPAGLPLPSAAKAGDSKVFGHRVPSSIPEPNSLLLVGLALIALSLIRWKHRRR